MLAALFWLFVDVPSQILEMLVVRRPAEWHMDVLLADPLGELLVNPPGVDHILPLLATELCGEKISK